MHAFLVDSEIQEKLVFEYRIYSLKSRSQKKLSLPCPLFVCVDPLPLSQHFLAMLGF